MADVCLFLFMYVFVSIVILFIVKDDVYNKFFVH